MSIPMSFAVRPAQSSGVVPSLHAASVPLQRLPARPMTFLEAIAREEGFYLAGTRPQRNNNPGDIEFGRFTRAHGAVAGDPRFAIFPDAASGFAAMQALFQCAAYRGLSVAAALNKYAPAGENQPSRYIANVCAWTGLTPETVIDAIVMDAPVPSRPVPGAAGTPGIIDA